MRNDHRDDRQIVSDLMEEKKNRIKFFIFFPVGFPGSDISLGSQCSCQLRFFSKLCLRVVDKKLPMPAYCVAANRNNSQMTPGITMHELPRNRPAMRRKWIKFIQFKRADFLAAPHHAHLCTEHFIECNFTNPMEYRMGFASKLTRCSGTLSKSFLTGSN